MALTSLDILRISEPVEQMYMDCAAQLLVNICSHFKSDKKLAIADWETQKLSELGALTDESIAIIAKTTGKSEKEIKKAVFAGMEKEVSAAEAVLSQAASAGKIQGVYTSWEASESVKAVLNNLTGQAVEHSNIVNTVMLQSTRTRYINAIQFAVTEELALIERLQSASSIEMLDDQLARTQRALNASTMSVATGAETREAALRRTVKQLAKQGITGYIDAGGHHWSPEAYINMDIRTTVHNAAIQGQKARSADYGVYVFQISSHAGARPLCAPYQGKFYSWNDDSGVVEDRQGNRYKYEPIKNTSYGQAAGIFGINCGHRPNTFISGYSKARFEPTEDEAENTRLYQLSQDQRQKERAIRNEKTAALCYEAAGDKEAAAAATKRAREKSAEYRAFCKANDITPRMNRTMIAST